MRELTQFVRYEKCKMEGKHADAVPVTGEGRLHDQDRFERCLFLFGDCQGSPEIVQVLLEQCPLSIQSMFTKIFMPAMGIRLLIYMDDLILPNQ